MIIPVMFGLFVTSQFQLRGAKALLVNLGVATVFRQLFKELKKKSFSRYTIIDDTKSNQCF